MGTGESGAKPVQSKNFNNFASCSGSKQGETECLNAKCKWARKTNNPWFGVLPNCTKGHNCYCPG